MLVLETYRECEGLPDFEPEREVIGQQYYLNDEYKRVELLAQELFKHLENINIKKGSSYGCRFYEV